MSTHPVAATSISGFASTHPVAATSISGFTHHVVDASTSCVAVSTHRAAGASTHHLVERLP